MDPAVCCKIVELWIVFVLTFVFVFVFVAPTQSAARIAESGPASWVRLPWGSTKCSGQANVQGNQMAETHQTKWPGQGPPTKGPSLTNRCKMAWTNKIKNVLSWPKCFYLVLILWKTGHNRFHMRGRFTSNSKAFVAYFEEKIAK